MRKALVATAFLAMIGAGAATAQTPPAAEPKAQPPQGSMMGEGMMHSDGGCPMMKKMASLEDRLKKLEQGAPKQQ
jgi:hypothetical protein